MTSPDPSLVAWSFRRQTIASCQGLLRIMHEATVVYGGDIEAFLIYLAISSASVDAALRDTELAANPPPPGPMSEHHFRAVSRRAVAASTGLPRETVRRKIAAFIEQGDLIAEGSGVRIPTGLLEEARHFAFAKVLIQEFARTGAQLTRLKA